MSAQIIQFRPRATEPGPTAPAVNDDLKGALASAAFLAEIAEIDGFAIVLTEPSGSEITHSVGDPTRIAAALARLHLDTLARVRP